MAGRVLVGGAALALALGAGWAIATDAPVLAPRDTAVPTAATMSEAAVTAPRKAGLRRFASCEAFTGHMRRRAVAEARRYRVSVPEALVGTAPAADAAASSPEAAPAREGIDYSGTNLQEAGVDEPDVVKTDGRTLFSVAGGRLAAVDVSGATPRRLGTTDLGKMYPTGMILNGDRLLVLGDGGGGVGIPIDTVATSPARAAIDIGPAGLPSTVLVQFDVSDPSAPRVVTRMRVEGRLVAARRTGDSVRVVLASSPAAIPLAAAREDAVRRAGPRAFLPRMTVRDAVRKTTTRRVAVGCTGVSRPTQFSGVGMVDVLTLGAGDDLRLLDADAILTDAEHVYASPTGLYVATTRWADPALAGNPVPPRGSTQIHKLDISDPARTTLLASGVVPGYLLNQFAMSEHDGVLRAASTEQPDWWSPPGVDPASRPSESYVTTLAERDGRLAVLGRVGGIGKGERIFAVRFVGTRGYVVTFRQVDPLYALDLSDPARPLVRGELKIPGFSSYLHPIDDTTLIGIGQAADAEGRTQGTQVSLFDVADPAAPRRLAQRTLDAGWSEAESDHHAVLWWAPTRTLVVPAQSYRPDGRVAFLGAVGMTVTRESGITPIARVAHPDQKEDTYLPVRRALVVGGSLYTVSETGVLASDLATLSPRTWVPLG